MNRLPREDGDAVRVSPVLAARAAEEVGEGRDSLERGSQRDPSAGVRSILVEARRTMDVIRVRTGPRI